MKFLLKKTSIVLILFSFCLNASEGIWDTGKEIFEKLSKFQAVGASDFTTPVLSDTPREMFGRAERAKTYFSKIKMKGRNVVTVLGDSHVFVSSLEPCYSDWCGSNILGFIDALANTSDSAFIKGFLCKSAEIEGKINKFNTSYLKEIIGTNNKDVLVQCLAKASENSNQQILHKAIQERLKNLTKLSGYTFFKELVEVIESANIKLLKVAAWPAGPKINEFNVVSIWQLASEILGDLDALAMDESRSMKIMSCYISGLISHLNFLSGIIGNTSITVPDGKGGSVQRNLYEELISAKNLLTNILAYSYGEGSKVSDVIKMLKESGSAQDFFHSESLLATFVFNKHILSHCGDDIVFYTQRDMCAVCEATWRKIADERKKGAIYVLSSEPYTADESWKRHDFTDRNKLIKIPTVFVDIPDKQNQFTRNLLINQRTNPTGMDGSTLYTAAKTLFVSFDKTIFQSSGFDLKQNQNEQIAEKIIDNYNAIINNYIQTLSDQENLSILVDQIKTIPKILEIDITEEIWENVLRNWHSKVDFILKPHSSSKCNTM